MMGTVGFGEVDEKIGAVFRQSERFLTFARKGLGTEAGAHGPRIDQIDAQISLRGFGCIGHHQRLEGRFARSISAKESARRFSNICGDEDG